MKKKVIKKFSAIFTIVLVSGCSSFPSLFNTHSSEQVETNGMDNKTVTVESNTTTNMMVNTTATPQVAKDTLPTGFSLGAMDNLDKSKFSHALDSSIGKSVQWTNAHSNISYTVTPTQKVVDGSNPFCRKYTVITTRGTQSKETQGTACVGQDGAWHEI